MPFIHRIITLAFTLSLSSTALANDNLDLVDAELDEALEDFSSDRSSRSPRKADKKAAKVNDEEALLDGFDEDPDWDMPSEPDFGTEDEDPSWDEDPVFDEDFGDAFEEEEDFVIPLTAPEPMVEEDEELAPQVEKVDESVISNDKPGLDLSVFDIED